MLSTRSPRSAAKKLLIVVAAAVLSISVSSAVQAQSYRTDDEASSRSLVNSARAQHGLGALTNNPGLDKVARAQAVRMAARDAIYHNPNLKSDADAEGVNWRWIGENVGVGPTVQAVHDAFMASQGHRENVLYQPYNTIGVGVVEGKDGSVFVAHVFATVDAAAPKPQPAAPAPKPAAKPVVKVAQQPVQVAGVTTVPVATDASKAPATTFVPVNPGPNVVVGGVVNR